MTTHFGSGGITGLGARAELYVADTALRFVQLGLPKSEGGATNVSMALLSASVKNHFMQRVLNNTTREPARGTPIAEVEQAQKASLLLLLKDFKRQAVQYRLTTVAPYLCALVEETEASLAVDAGCQGAPRQAPDEEPLEKAYAMCKLNVQRIEQRLGLLYTLADMLQHVSRQYGLTVDCAISLQVEQVASFLFQQRQTFLVRTLAMGSLLGGVALEENRALAKKMFCSGMSAMSLTRLDALLPNHYTSSEEEALLLAIKNA